MTKLSSYILFLSLFLLAACDSAKKEFMTPKQGGIVIDVNNDEYSLNGTVIGKTATDISASKDLLIEPLDNELKEIRRIEQEEVLRKGIPADESNARLHIDENLSYDVFYKVMATMAFSGYVSIQYVIGSNFKEPLAMDLPKRSQLSFSEDHVAPFNCSQARNRRAIGKLLERKHHKNILADEIAARRIKNTEMLIECARRYIGLSLTLRSDEDFSYVVGLNESGLIDGGNYIPMKI